MKIVFSLAAGLASTALVAASPALSEVQASKANTLQFINSVCSDALSEDAAMLQANTGKSVAEICDCTADEMWSRFPNIRYWVQETNPYEWQQVTDAFPDAVSLCIIQ